MSFAQSPFSSSSNLSLEDPSFLHPEGFSSSLVLKFEEEIFQARPSSKLLSITSNSGQSKGKNIVLPVFYRKQFSSIQAIKEPEEQARVQKKQLRPCKITSTTFGSMHTLSNLDGENHDFFNEKSKFQYEKEVKSSIHEGSSIAYCHKCKKETVCAVSDKEKSFVDLLFCCCSNWNIKGKNFICPTCAEVLKAN